MYRQRRVHTVTRRTRVLVIMPSSQNSVTTMCHRVGFRLHALTPHQAPTPVLQSHGMTRATLMTRRLVMVTLLTTQRKKKPSSIIVTTSAVRLISQMIKPISLSMMLTCHTVNFSLTSIAAPKNYHISSTANSSMKRQVCTIMVQGT